jgi:uncharacterized protein (DUF1499 family)
MTTATITGRTMPVLAPIAARLALGLALLAGLLLIAGPVGWRVGWWHFRLAFGVLMPWAGYVAAGGLAVALLTLLLLRRSLGRGGLVAVLLGLALSAAILYFPLSWSLTRGKFPPLHDITTDPADPPAFAAVLPARQAESGNSTAYDQKEAALQKQFFPDIAPLTTPLAPAKAFAYAHSAARAMPGWRIIAEDPAAGRIEASQSSRWFGFTDDIVIRIVAAEGGSRIDVRSESRQGRGDFGVNATRVRAYLARLRPELPAP